MSLVNEALKKARLEAARQDAARRGLPLPGAPPRAARAIGPAALFRVAAVAVILGVAVLIFFVGRRSSAPTRSPAAVAERLAVEPAASTEIEALPAADGEAQPSAPAPPPVEPAPRELRAETPPAPTATEPEPATTSSRARVTTAWEPEATPRRAPPPTVSEPAAPAPQRPMRIVAPEPAASAPAPEPPPQPVETVVRRLELPGSVPIELGGIAWSEERPFALINGRVVGPGDRVETLTVVAIEPRHVELRGQEGSYLLRLK